MAVTATLESAFEDLVKGPKASPLQGNYTDTPRIGRPPKPGAKSRDPEYRAWTGYLKRETVVEAEYLLKRTGSGETVSSKLQELLAGWLAEQKRS